MMDPAGARRLRDEQYRAIQDTTTHIQQLQKYIDDYVSLSDRLKTLPDKIKHEVMVPFGKFGFMPGELVHTNEVLVLLGDNWFCQRSAKQAAEIAGRRVQALKKQQDDLVKQQQLLEPRLGYTSELHDIMQDESDIFEIKEEFDPEAEEVWREQHKKNLRVHRESERTNQMEAASPRRPNNQSQTSPGHADADIWRRLDELEQHERRNREMARMPDATPDGEIHSIPPQTQHIPSHDKSHDSFHHQSHHPTHDAAKRVRWEDKAGLVETPGGQECGDSESTDSGEYSSYDETNEGDKVARPRTIYFTHTATHGDTVAGAEASAGVEARTSTVSMVQSPGDIYTCYIQTPAGTPRSILKTPSDTFQLQPDVKPKRPHVVQETMTESGDSEAFTGKILEIRDPTHTERTTSQPGYEPKSSAQSVPQITEKPAKKVSRFKARQMERRS